MTRGGGGPESVMYALVGCLVPCSRGSELKGDKQHGAPEPRTAGSTVAQLMGGRAQAPDWAAAGEEGCRAGRDAAQRAASTNAASFPSIIFSLTRLQFLIVHFGHLIIAANPPEAGWRLLIEFLYTKT